MYAKRRGNFVDVFTGSGWDNYSKFEIHKGKVILLDGVSISDADYKQLLEMVRNARS